MRTPPRLVPLLALTTALTLAAALSLLPVLAGCSRMPRMLGGSPDVALNMDGEQNFETELPPGHTLTLDVRDPGKSGYAFAGVSFDTDLLRLDSVLPYDAGARVRYVFATLKEGQCDVLIKIRLKDQNYKPDVFKRVHVKIQP